MPYATVLFFEEDSERIIRGIWEGLAKEDIPLDFSSDIRPHMTLGIYDELSCRLCEKGLEKLAIRSANLSITFSSFGIFREPESVLFLASTTTKELLDFHAHIHSELSDWVKKPWELYLPGNWVPHCTLALGIQLDQFNKAISICSQLKLPLTLKTAQIGVVEFHPVNELFKYELGMTE
jgi:2'-5' RNA ligase